MTTDRNFDEKEYPLVSVISVFYNRAGHVAESVQSLIDQDYPNLEIIIVDDGSTDGTRQALEAFRSERTEIVSQSNRGFVASMREAIERANGEYIAVHGSGDLSYRTRISEQARILMRDPQIGVVGCHLEADRNFGGDERIVSLPNGLPFRETLMKRNLFSHGEVMFRRNVYDKVGGYRGFFKFAQDRDLWLRMSRHCDYAIVPQVLYRRKILEEGVGSSLDKLVLQGYLADFAVQCAAAVDRGEPDPLEAAGNLAPFLRRRSPDLAERFASVGLRWMLLRDERRGWELLQRAASEAGSVSVYLKWLLGATHAQPTLWRAFFKPLLTRWVR